MDFQAFIEWFNAHDTMCAGAGVRLTEMGEGYARGVLVAEEGNRNVMGGLHGGALATLTDILAGCAVVHHGRKCVTLDASIRYLKAVRSGVVTGEAKELHGGNRTAVSQVEVRDEAGDLCCVCTTTMFLLDQPAVFNV